MGPLVSHTILKAYLELRNAKQRKERKHRNRKLSVDRKQRIKKHKNFIGMSV